MAESQLNMAQHKLVPVQIWAPGALLMKTLAWCPAWVTAIILILLAQPHTIASQLTQYQSGCTFLDGVQNVFNIEIQKGSAATSCPTMQDVNEQFKATDDKLSETTYEVMQLQSQVLRLMDTSLNLTLELQKLSEELRATQYALQSTESVSVDCPSQYEVKSDDLQSCYMFVGRQLSWYNAQIFCMSTRGYLAAVESDKEQEFLINYIRSSRVLPGYHMWIGGTDIASEGSWVWAGTNNAFNYTNWMTYPSQDPGSLARQPDNLNDNENCVQLFHLYDYLWNDYDCASQFYFICEYKML